VDCQWCQAEPATTTDHVVSVYDADAVVGAGMLTREEARAAVNDQENLLGACASCNPSKGTKLPGNVPGTWPPPNPTPRAIDKMKQLGTWQEDQ
jgi:5-methylcytosine-specific restriction endonuclease McrA